MQVKINDDNWHSLSKEWIKFYCYVEFEFHIFCHMKNPKLLTHNIW